MENQKEIIDLMKSFKEENLIIEKEFIGFKEEGDIINYGFEFYEGKWYPYGWGIDGNHPFIEFLNQRNISIELF